MTLKINFIFSERKQVFDKTILKTRSNKNTKHIDYFLFLTFCFNNWNYIWSFVSS